jgi:hypothetical protein
MIYIIGKGDKMSKEFTKESMSKIKPIPGAITPEFILGMANVLAFGANKYGRDNWAKCKKNQIYLYWDALYRHLEAYRSGIEFDEETGLSHLSHAACNLMFIQHLTDKYKRKEDEH